MADDRTRRTGRLASLALVLGLTLTVGFGGALAQGTPVADELPNPTIIFNLPDDDVFPEGIAYDADTSTFFTGSVMTGTIYQGNTVTETVTTFTEGADVGLTQALGMALDPEGRLWVAGGESGMIAIFDVDTAEILGVAGPSAEGSFLNDLVVGPDGTIWVTDSFLPQVLRVTYDEQAELAVAEVIDLSGTDFVYDDEGINANGVVASDDGAYLLIAKTVTGQLFRLETATGDVTEVDTSDVDLTFADGMALDGDLLYVVRNQANEVVRLTVNDDFSAVTLVDRFSDPHFAFPTTIALADDDRALIPNGQLDRLETGDPELPFTVVSVIRPPLPGEAATPVAATPVAATPVAG